jgi:hypothetical protein
MMDKMMLEGFARSPSIVGEHLDGVGVPDGMRWWEQPDGDSHAPAAY